MSKRDILLAIHNFSELNNLANNAKIRSSLKFLLKRYMYNHSLKSFPIYALYSNLFEFFMTVTIYIHYASPYTSQACNVNLIIMH